MVDYSFHQYEKLYFAFHLEFHLILLALFCLFFKKCAFSRLMLSIYIDNHYFILKISSYLLIYFYPKLHYIFPHFLSSYVFLIYLLCFLQGFCCCCFSNDLDLFISIFQVFTLKILTYILKIIFVKVFLALIHICITLLLSLLILYPTEQRNNPIYLFVLLDIRFYMISIYHGIIFKKIIGIVSECTFLVLECYSACLGYFAVYALCFEGELEGTTSSCVSLA